MPVTQPLILVDEPAPLAAADRPQGVAEPRAGGANRRGRWRSAAVWGAVLVVTLIVVAQLREPRPEPSPAADGAAGSDGAVGADWTTGGPTDASGLLVRVIPPNEAVAVFSRPGHRFCGDLELHLDGSPAPIRMLVETGAGLLVTFEVPAQAASGPHAVELISGTPAPKAVGACRESARYRRTIAVTTAHV